jgi:hypothetical protein
VQINVNSKQEANKPPRSYTFDVQWASAASIETRVDLDPDKAYDLYVAVADGSGRSTGSDLRQIDAESTAFDPKVLLRVLGGLVSRWRRWRGGGR